MIAPLCPVPQDPDERLQEVAGLLAVAILRRKLRTFRASRRRRDEDENCLELSGSLSAHATKPSRGGEHR